MVKIKIWGEIDSKTSYIVEEAVSEITDSTEPVLININSVGGFMSDAIAIINSLKSIENPLITVCMGNCISAAAMIFAIGKKRYVSEDISYMIHQPYSPAAIRNVNYSKLKELMPTFKKDLDIYLKYVITNETCIPPEKLKSVKDDGRELYLTAKECLKYKIATNKFTSWNDLYKREKIDPNEKISRYDSFVESYRGCRRRRRIEFSFLILSKIILNAYIYSPCYFILIFLLPK